MTNRNTTCAIVLTLFAFFCFASARLRAQDDLDRRGDHSSVIMGIDRSNMDTEWTLSPPSEPNIEPFNGNYNTTFDARRTAIFNGIGNLHPEWFRDNVKADTPQDMKLFVDTVRQIHEHHIKMLAIIRPITADFAPQDVIQGSAANGCGWATAPLSKIEIAKFTVRMKQQFDLLKAADERPDAFEIGNELDLYCNDADAPTPKQVAAHQWKWFAFPTQHAWETGYAKLLKASSDLIREYFPGAKIITVGLSNARYAPLIAGLVNLDDGSGGKFDYTTLVDGYGIHIYPPADTTYDMVQTAYPELVEASSHLPHRDQKAIWITEWNESESSLWSNRPWYFQYTAQGETGGDLNRADAGHHYPAMTRAQVIRTFKRDVIEALRTRRSDPVNISHLFYYAYDASGAPSPANLCDHTGFNIARSRDTYTTGKGETKFYGIGNCFSGVIDPVVGKPLPDIAAALFGSTDRAADRQEN